MLDRLIERYNSLDEESRRVVNFLALTQDMLNMNEIAGVFHDIKQKRLTEIVKQETIIYLNI
jgi:hypothetical protein